ncbi:hypothetical protein BJ508DRAFT_326426 [Ascobolus immersus RN42]|uniref:Uncharacterized protein n=1 Tax=Ascobolus immersus RN42 TaxID=1160509 RepID=A0A3N4IBF6_ASCIM|nr:hypothetical protein BJ508DRAFT_326426 [Ascobolus immersus RN42]
MPTKNAATGAQKATNSRSAKAVSSRGNSGKPTTTRPGVADEDKTANGKGQNKTTKNASKTREQTAHGAANAVDLKPPPPAQPTKKPTKKVTSAPAPPPVPAKRLSKHTNTTVSDPPPAAKKQTKKTVAPPPDPPPAPKKKATKKAVAPPPDPPPAPKKKATEKAVAPPSDPPPAPKSKATKKANAKENTSLPAQKKSTSATGTVQPEAKTRSGHGKSESTKKAVVMDGKGRHKNPTTTKGSRLAQPSKRVEGAKEKGKDDKKGKSVKPARKPAAFGPYTSATHFPPRDERPELEDETDEDGDSSSDELPAPKKRSTKRDCEAFLNVDSHQQVVHWKEQIREHFAENFSKSYALVHQFREFSYQERKRICKELGRFLQEHRGVKRSERACFLFVDQMCKDFVRNNNERIWREECALAEAEGRTPPPRRGKGRPRKHAIVPAKSSSATTVPRIATGKSKAPQNKLLMFSSLAAFNQWVRRNSVLWTSLVQDGWFITYLATSQYAGADESEFGEVLMDATGLAELVGMKEVHLIYAEPEDIAERGKVRQEAAAAVKSAATTKKSKPKRKADADATPDEEAPPAPPVKKPKRKADADAAPVEEAPPVKKPKRKTDAAPTEEAPPVKKPKRKTDADAEPVPGDDTDIEPVEDMVDMDNGIEMDDSFALDDDIGAAAAAAAVDVQMAAAEKKAAARMMRKLAAAEKKAADAEKKQRQAEERQRKAEEEKREAEEKARQIQEDAERERA